MTPAEALKTINNADGCKYCDIGEALGVAIAVLREKVEREAEKKPKGPTLDAMALSVDPEAVWTFPDDQINAYRNAAAAVLRKLDEWLKAESNDPYLRGNKEGLCRYLGLPGIDP